MFSKLLENGTKLALIPFASWFKKDPDDIAIDQLKLEPHEINQTGWERVKQMYTIDEFGEIKPELNSIIQVGAVSMLFGALFGGFRESKDAYMDFMKNNTATTFKTHLEAKREMQTHMTLSFGKGAFKWAKRVTLFSVPFMAIVTTMQVYRNKFGILEYSVGGGLAGATYRFHLGPKGCVAGLIVGSALGCFCGTITLGLLTLTGTSMEEAHKWRYKLRESRTASKKQMWKDYYEEKDDPIIKLHDLNVGKAGHTLDVLGKEENKEKEKL